jgi:hypothetical protein
MKNPVPSLDMPSEAEKVSTGLGRSEELQGGVDESSERNPDVRDGDPGRYRCPRTAADQETSGGTPAGCSGTCRS